MSDSNESKISEIVFVQKRGLSAFDGIAGPRSRSSQAAPVLIRIARLGTPSRTQGKQSK